MLSGIAFKKVQFVRNGRNFSLKRCQQAVTAKSKMGDSSHFAIIWEGCGQMPDADRNAFTKTTTKSKHLLRGLNCWQTVPLAES